MICFIKPNKMFVVELYCPVNQEGDFFDQLVYVKRRLRKYITEIRYLTVSEFALMGEYIDGPQIIDLGLGGKVTIPLPEYIWDELKIKQTK